MIWSAVIPAAGSGTRLGLEQPKQFLQVHGKPLLAHTLSALEKSGSFNQLILVLDEQGLATVTTAWLQKYGLAKQCEYTMTLGGATRSESVYAGLQCITTADFVAIHDAARPCVSKDLIKQLLQVAETSGAAIPGYPVYDSLKRCKSGDQPLITESMSRQQLYLVQTPQCFRLDVIRQAYQLAMANQQPGADDAELVERIGHPVRVVLGDRQNMKLTYVDEIEQLEQQLAPSRVSL